MSFSVASKTEETRRSRREVRKGLRKDDVYKRCPVNKCIALMLKSNAYRRCSNFCLSILLEANPDSQLSRGTVRAFAFPLKDLFSLCYRGLRHNEEHRRGDTIPPRCQYSAQRRQGGHHGFIFTLAMPGEEDFDHCVVTSVCSVLTCFIFPAA